MTIHRTPKALKIEIDLLGPEGNALCILGAAQNLMKQLGYSKVVSEAVLKSMQSADYKHLVDVFEAEFSFLVDIYNYNEVFPDAN